MMAIILWRADTKKLRPKDVRGDLLLGHHLTPAEGEANKTDA